MTKAARMLLQHNTDPNPTQTYLVKALEHERCRPPQSKRSPVWRHDPCSGARLQNPLGCAAWSGGRGATWDRRRRSCASAVAAADEAPALALKRARISAAVSK